jgi:hypothetical protein
MARKANKRVHDNRAAVVIGVPRVTDAFVYGATTLLAPLLAMWFTSHNSLDPYAGTVEWVIALVGGAFAAAVWTYYRWRSTSTSVAAGFTATTAAGLIVTTIIHQSGTSWELVNLLTALAALAALGLAASCGGARVGRWCVESGKTPVNMARTGLWSTASFLAGSFAKDWLKAIAGRLLRSIGGWIGFVLIISLGEAPLHAQASTTVLVNEPFCVPSTPLTHFTLALRKIAAVNKWRLVQAPCVNYDASQFDKNDEIIVVFDGDTMNSDDTAALDRLGFVKLNANDAAPWSMRTSHDGFTSLGRGLRNTVKAFAGGVSELPPVPTILVSRHIAPDRLQAIREASAWAYVQALAGVSSSACDDAFELFLRAANRSGNAQARIFTQAALDEYRAAKASNTEAARRAREGLARQLAAPALCVSVRTPFGFSEAEARLTAAIAHFRKALNAFENSQTLSPNAQRELDRAYDCIARVVQDPSKDAACHANDYGMWQQAFVPAMFAAEITALKESSK